jgi:hypothetical protein
MPDNEETPIRETAEKWLAGSEIPDLAEEYDCDDAVIRRRIKLAKVYHPDLPWDNRKRGVTFRSPTKDYVEMNDGKPGTKGFRPGSIIPKDRRQV